MGQASVPLPYLISNESCCLVPSQLNMDTRPNTGIKTEVTPQAQHIMINVMSDN